MNEIAAPSVAASEPAPNRVTFHGVRAEFRRLVSRAALLELVTFGFYRFWIATDMRRHLWSNTAVEGDVAEYTGTAKELLIGFLFALAILVPIYVIYFLLGLEAERLQAFASIPLVLFYYLFAQFAIYRARRYRLSRTVWRGVRLWMSGSGVSYAWRAALWGLLMILTLGLALPWRTAALERFKMRQTYYGDLHGRFDGTGGAFFKRGWWLWLLAWISIPIFPLALVFIYAAYKAIEWRWWISGLRIGEVRFESDLRSGALMGLYWKVIGWGVLISFGLVIWVLAVFGIAYAIRNPSNMSPEEVTKIVQQLPVLLAMGLGYVISALLFGIVIRLYLTRDLWVIVATSTAVHNLAAAENVSVQGELTSALGEGLADSLDVGGF